MGKEDEAPPAPDYAPLAEASKLSAEYSFEIAKSQLEWAKTTYAADKEVIDKVVDSFLETQETNTETAAKDRLRYETIFQPLEDKLAADAESYSSPERREQEMGRAAATVGQQFQGAREAATRQLESYGVNPAATRFGALDIGVRAQEAAAKAAAANEAARATDATGRALRSEAINVGRGYPGQIAGQYGTGNNAGNSAGAQQLGGTASGAATMGTAPQWQGMGNGAIGTWGNILNQGYQNQMAQYNANQAASSGVGTALGLAGALMFAADGGAVPAARAPGATPGGAVPIQSSPSRGTKEDDVDARLTAGEFVMPKDAVLWHGEKAMYAMIQKAREAREEAKAETGAIPEMRMAPPARPTFESRAAVG